MKPAFQRMVLYGVLSGALAFAYSVFRADESAAEDVVSPAGEKVRPARIPLITNSVQRLPLERMDKTFVAANDENPFAIKSWAVAAPTAVTPVQVASKPVPTAPPLPYSFAGKLDLGDGAWVVYLAKGEQSFAVSKGETFDINYRLDSIEEGNLVIVYLPLGSKQLLPIATE